MKTILFSAFAVMLGLGSGWSQNEKKADAPAKVDKALAEAISALEDAAATYVKAFNTQDSQTIANLFMPDGELVLLSGASILGRGAIKAHYDEVFSTGEKYTASYESGSARMLTHGVVAEDATMSFTSPDGEVSVHPYTAVYIKQADGSWLIARERDLSGDYARPVEKLQALQGLIGNWVVQVDGSDTWITFDWSTDGPFIDAHALTQKADIQSTAATLRIGWDALRGEFVSWGFDSLGGYNFSEWTKVDDRTYLLKTRGVTADGELLTATQEIAMAADGESFAWTKRDQVIDGELMPDRTLTAVKRPPQPKIVEPKTKSSPSE